MEEKIELILLKLKSIEKKVDNVMATVESHRIEHGFQKMQDGGINANFENPENNGSSWPRQGMPPGMPGQSSQQGLGQGYQTPGWGQPPQHPPGFGPGQNDPSRPPDM